jgi:hypothetical protein
MKTGAVHRTDRALHQGVAGGNNNGPRPRARVVEEPPVPRYEVVPVEHCTGSHLLTRQALRRLLGLPRVMRPYAQGKSPCPDTSHAFRPHEVRASLSIQPCLPGAVHLWSCREVGRWREVNECPIHGCGGTSCATPMKFYPLARPAAWQASFALSSTPSSGGRGPQRPKNGHLCRNG